MNTKPLRLRFVSAIYTIVQLFFDFSGPLGLTAFFGKAYVLLKLASKMYKKPRPKDVTTR